MIKLQEDERIILTARKHWFVLLGRVIGLLVLLILPFLLYYVLLTSPPEIAQYASLISVPLFVFIGSAWTLLLWTQFFSVWSDHYLDAWIITNQRIIDIDQHGFFNRRLGSFRLERVQDVTIEVEGLIATLLDFGDIHVQTAGEAQNFIIRGIPHPKQVKQIVLAQIDNATAEQTGVRFNPEAGV